MSKPGRNEPCPCGSGKKFKKCCEAKMIKGRFLAKQMQTNSSGIASFFNKNVAKETPFTLKGRQISIKSNTPSQQPQKQQNVADSPENTPKEKEEKSEDDKNS